VGRRTELQQLVLGLLGNRQGVRVWSDARDGNLGQYRL